jgi:hypothetical protein
MDLKARVQELSRLVFIYCLHSHLQFVTEVLMLNFRRGFGWSAPVFDTDCENLEENFVIYLWFILNNAFSAQVFTA